MEDMNTKLEALFDEVSLSKAKEELKQEKLRSTQVKVETELFEQASKLQSQTQAADNVTTLLAAAEALQGLDWADDTLKKQSVHLLKDALKRARATYK